MTAKTNRISRPQTGDDTDMHFRAAKRHEELVEEVQALRRAGLIGSHFPRCVAQALL